MQTRGWCWSLGVDEDSVLVETRLRFFGPGENFQTRNESRGCGSEND